MMALLKCIPPLDGRGGLALSWSDTRKGSIAFSLSMYGQSEVRTEARYAFADVDFL